MSRAQYEQQGTREAWEQQQVTGYECPFCATVYPKDRSDCDGTDIVCCAEIGECLPYYLELEQLQ